jgi:hypothetical protein
MPLYNPTLPNPSGFQSGTPTGVIAETNHRYNLASNNTVLGVSGTLYVMSISLQTGMTIGHIGFGNGTSATTAVTHWWLCLLDNTFVQQAHTADQLTSNVAASTWYNLATVNPYTATYNGTYYLGIVATITSGAMPSPLSPSFSPITQIVTGTSVPTPLLGGLSSTGLTTPGTDGTTTYLAPTGIAVNYYMYCTA